MKKIKFLVLILFLFLLTGCDGSYEIEIYKDRVKETSYLLYDKNELNNLSPYDKTIEIVSLYDDNGDFLINDKQKEFKKGSKSGIKFIRNFKSIDSFKEESKILGSCYVATNLSQNNDLITLKTSNEFTCMNEVKEFQNITLAVKTNHKVKEHNADKKKGHTYYWYLDKNNYKNKPISIKMYKDEYVWNYNHSILKRVILFILLAVILVGIAYFCYKKYNKDMNDFGGV